MTEYSAFYWCLGIGTSIVVLIIVLIFIFAIPSAKEKFYQILSSLLYLGYVIVSKLWQFLQFIGNLLLKKHRDYQPARKIINMIQKDFTESYPKVKRIHTNRKCLRILRKIYSCVSDRSLAICLLASVKIKPCITCKNPKIQETANLATIRVIVHIILRSEYKISTDILNKYDDLFYNNLVVPILVPRFFGTYEKRIEFYRNLFDNFIQNLKK